MLSPEVVLELEELFGKNDLIKQSSDEKIESPIESKIVSLLDLSRANNMSIMLARMRLSYSEIKRAILELDDQTLSIDNLKSLKQYVPAFEEIQLVRNYDGDISKLGNAEKYVLEVMDIPRLNQRLESMIFKRKFMNEYEEILPNISNVLKASDESRKSGKLEKILRIVLDIGNFMNGSTNRGSAYGFQLEALIKLKDTKVSKKDNDGTPTLLHYLVRFLNSKEPECLDFGEDIPALKSAARGINIFNLLIEILTL